MVTICLHRWHKNTAGNKAPKKLFLGAFTGGPLFAHDFLFPDRSFYWLIVTIESIRVITHCVSLDI